jgi:hypothetical protein
MVSGKLGMASTELGMVSGKLGMAPVECGMASSKLGMASTEVGMVSGKCEMIDCYFHLGNFLLGLKSFVHYTFFQSTDTYVFNSSIVT